MGGNRKRTGAKKVAANAGQMPIDELVEGPTPEQSDRVNYQKTTHTDEMGAKVGFGYRREPWFETLNRASANAITRDELLALRFYRAAFDRCERSPTKSCLNVGVGGGLRDPGSSIVSSTPAIVEARRKVRLCESVLGSWLVTVRAVALQDRSFSDIAIERFGGRKQDWIIVDEPVLKDGRPVKVGGKVLTAPVTREKIVPRSGRHRETIRQEFYAGLRLLTKQVRTLVSTPGIEEIWVEPGVRSASIRRGVAAPNGLYRLWGNSDRIDDVLSRLRAKHGDGLDFATPADARTALDEADGGMLLRLSEQELSR